MTSVAAAGTETAEPIGGEQAARAYFDELAACVGGIDAAQVSRLAHAVAGAVEAGHGVLLAGNGGSAAAAEHFASDWQAALAARYGRGGISVVSLTGNVARLTAAANDVSYEEAIACQLAERASAGDLLVLLSVSGESRNLVRAAETARQLGVTVTGVLGNEGAVSAHCDLYVLAGDGDYGLAEDLQIAVNHSVVRLLYGGRARRLPIAAASRA